MKVLTIINWVIICLYVLFALMLVIDLQRPNDPMGRGMASGFLMVAVILLLAVLVLNLIPTKWTRILGLVIGLGPAIVIYGSRALDSIQWTIAEKNKRSGRTYFQDKTMKAIAGAIGKEQYDKVADLLEQSDIDINLIGEEGFTLLDVAVEIVLFNDSRYSNSKEAMRILDLLLKKGADPNVHSSTHNPVLMEVVWMGPVALFEKLLQNGANPNALDKKGAPIIFNLLQGASDRLEKFQLLLDHGADPNLKYEGEGWRVNFSPLVYAASIRYWEGCTLLIKKGADLDYALPNGESFWSYYDQTKKEYEENGASLEVFEELSALVSKIREQ